MDGGTDARYIALVPNGSYLVTTCEHLFVRVEESGLWSRTGSRIAFIPKAKSASPYSAEEISYRGHVLLALKGDAAPSIAVPIAEIKKNPKELPLYVFFEVSGSVYEQESKQTYTFHFAH